MTQETSASTSADPLAFRVVRGGLFVAASSHSNILFGFQRSAEENLQREGRLHDKICFVGKVMIDMLLRHREWALQTPVLERFDAAPGEYVLVRLHRPRNVDDAAKLTAIVEALSQGRERLSVIFPVHPRTRNRLKEFGLLERAMDLLGARLRELLGYLELLHLMARGRVVLTDSGGIQEETTIPGVPCLTLRPVTERPATVTVGTNWVIGSAPERVVPEVECIPGLLIAVSGPRRYHHLC